MDEHRYWAEVLRLPDGETEEEAEERLLAEARELGLKLPEIEIAASFAASISGVLDTSSPRSSSLARPSLDRSSLSDCVTPGATSVDHLSHSLSETTISDNIPSGSLPSIDSSSTRLTSFSSSDGRLAHIISPLRRNGSMSSAASSARRKRTSFINAIGKLPFRKRRSTSSVALPPSTQITVQKKEGNVDTVLIETKAETPELTETSEGEEILKVEVPLFDEAALQRSLENPELKELYESHKMERLRFIALQNETLDSLRQKHGVAIAEKKSDNERMEKAKSEQVRIYPNLTV